MAEDARAGLRPWLAGVAALAVVIVAVAVVVVVRSGPAAPTDALGAPRFVDETVAAGVDHAYVGDWRFFEGGGVAVFDCDDDGMLDLYFAGGEDPAVLYRNVGEPGATLSFEPVVTGFLELEDVTGAYPLDIDSDGIEDLAVLRIGGNAVMRGTGDCSFEPVHDTWGIDPGSEWTVGFSATWEPGEELPTLAFGNYLASVDVTQLTDGADLCASNVLVRPDGDAYGEPIPLEPSWCTLSMLFSDWSRRGVADLRVTNDRQYYRTGEEQMWRLAPGAGPASYTRDEGWNHLQIWGMGIASHDVTGDGYPEVYLTSQGDSKLQALSDGPDRPSYRDIAIRRGVTAHAPYTGDDPRPSTAWHPEFDDVNNDGFTDLFVSKGNVDAMPTFTDEDPNNLFLGQPDGSFLEGAMDAGIVHFDRTRGAALADLDRDGLLDLVEVNREAPVRLWRNLGTGDGDESEAMGNWVALRLEQPPPNPAGVGSWIEVAIDDHVITRELTVGGGHAGGEWDWIHVGLGPASSADITVTWPDGQSETWQGVDANRWVTLTRGDPEANSIGDPIRRQEDGA